MDGVTVKLYGNNGVIATTTTNGSGNFTFTGPINVPLWVDIQDGSGIVPISCGVNSTDLQFIQNNVQLLSPPVSPNDYFRLIASDVNSDFLITTADLILVNKCIQNVGCFFLSWKFIPVNTYTSLANLYTSLGGPSYSPAFIYASEIFIPAGTLPVTGLNYFGIKNGDPVPIHCPLSTF